MKTLSDILLADHHQDALMVDCAKLFDTHISSLGGLKGLGIKSAWAIIKSAKSDLSLRAARRMLPDMAVALDPLYQKFKKSSVGDFGVFLGRHAEEAGATILAIADEKIATTHVAGARAMYQKFRGMAEPELQVLAPKLGKLFAAYLS